MKWMWHNTDDCASRKGSARTGSLDYNSDIAQKARFDLSDASFLDIIVYYANVLLKQGKNHTDASGSSRTQGLDRLSFYCYAAKSKLYLAIRNESFIDHVSSV